MLRTKVIGEKSSDGRLLIVTVKVMIWVEYELKGSVKELNILIYFFFLPIAQSCSVSDVLFTGGRGVSDFSVLKY